ncbi:hypothetical protein EV424DRAFT_1470126 [Suillus variegatus]|nr:hypothetical protein EV424DRAFT_1470126 [Suillus variegatus]
MDRQIVIELQKHFNTSHYGLGTHQQMHTVETIREVMTDLRLTYPNAGACEMVSLLFHEQNMRVNNIFAVDQHDKWLRYSLGLHTGIEPFLGRIMWMRVWHSNRNPQLILSYYLNTLDMFGHKFFFLSDPGSENFGIANAHTMLHQLHDPALQGTLQHRWMRNKKNVMPKITWSQMQCQFTLGFESLLDHGVMSGWYDSNNTLQMIVFQWVFIPWLQQELDAYQDQVNNTRKRRDRNKILPHGVPNIVYQSPEDFSALDFKVRSTALDHVRNLYIDPSHIIFDLMPQSFGKLIQCCYEELGCPSVTRQSAWDIYLLLLDMLQGNKEIPSAIEDVKDEDNLPLLENHQDLPYCEENNGTYYMGGVGGGLGLGDKDLYQLDNLICDDEPDTAGSIDEDIVELDHDGLVVWEFSDFSDVSDGDADVPVDEW